MNMKSLQRINWVCAAFLAMVYWSHPLQAQQLPPVTGVVYDGQQISWNALPNAIGYNVYLDFNYLDTVKGETLYTPDTPGEYRIVGFDGNGNFSPLQVIEADVVPTTNSAVVNAVSGQVSAPENVTGTVYSRTAGEIFWNRVTSQSLEYDIYLNNILIGSTTGTSYFIDVLIPATSNTLSVATRDCCGGNSDQVTLIFDTSTGSFPQSAMPLDTDTPDEVVPSPQNVTIEIYGSTVAELFWDRPPSSANVVSTDIFRDGRLIGSSPGTSFFDDTREIGARNRYELIAINADGTLSAATIINPDALDGDAEAIVQRLTSGITDVTNNNPHQQYFGFLRSLTNSTLPEELTQLSIEQIEDDNGQLVFRTLYQCEVGTLTIDNLMTRFGSYRLVFDFCEIDNSGYLGEVFIGGQDLGGYVVNYNSLYIEGFTPGTEIDGQVSLTIGRANNFKSLSYESLRYYSIAEDDIDTVVDLTLQLSDNINTQPRTEMSTSFTVSAPWTLDETITITTNEAFTEAESGNGNYINGELTVEAPDGERLVFTADTGDASTWQAKLFKTDSATEVFGNWSDTVRLPCISVTQGAEIPGCQAR